VIIPLFLDHPATHGNGLAVEIAAITDGLIFMAVIMVIVRTAGLSVRASRLPRPAQERENIPA
jgi:hypothetical protein